MPRQSKLPINFRRPNCVAVAGSPDAIQSALDAPGNTLDVVELRIDLLGETEAGKALQAIKLPVIATCRSLDEGGAPAFPQDRRDEVLSAFARHCSAVDIELAAVQKMPATMDAVRYNRCAWIASAHNFSGSPSLDQASRMLYRAADRDASVFKLASTPSAPSQVGALLRLLDQPPIPVALMAMGRLGRASRLLFAACGSALNYCSLGQAVVPGQWDALEFRRLLDMALGCDDPTRCG